MNETTRRESTITLRGEGSLKARAGEGEGIEGIEKSSAKLDALDIKLVALTKLLDVLMKENRRGGGGGGGVRSFDEDL